MSIDKKRNKLRQS